MTTHISQINGLNMDVLQKTVDDVRQNPELGACKFRVKNSWIDGGHNCSVIHDFYAAKQEMVHDDTFALHADEPAMLAGNDQGANPVEHLLHALASCVTTSMVAHAAVRGINIDEVHSEIEGDIDLRGFLGLDDSVPKGFTNIRVKFSVKADVDDLNKLKELCAFSPVYNTLTNGVPVDIDIQELQPSEWSLETGV